MNLENAYILAIETSSRTGSAAIGRGDRILAQIQFPAGTRHGVELIPSVDAIVRQADLQPGQIQIICVSSGPGSFTGLRVGFTFARCLSQITGAKLIAVPSTRVITENLIPLLADRPGPIYLAPVLDAKRRQVYTAGFCWKGGRIQQVLDECVLHPQQLLRQLGRPLWITGEGLDYHREVFPDQSDITLVDREYWLGRAGNVLKLGLQLARLERFVDCNDFVPTYVRLPEAEERWQLRQNEQKSS